MSEQFFRSVWYYIRTRERQILRGLRANPKALLSRLMHADMIRASRVGVCRGLAIGMFWGFAPMPFQMIPATFFCWLARANLPAAIICVWISNPFTYAPIFFAEYKIGVFLSGEPGISWDEFRMMMNEGENLIMHLLQRIGEPLLHGALVAATFMALSGYAGGALLFHRIQKRKRRRAKRPRDENAHPR